MIDTIILNIKAGAGGDGGVSFHREKFIPRGGPDGGDGGDGGDVYICGDGSLNTLLHLRYTDAVSSEEGGNGSGNNRHGRKGTAITVRVPIGTIVTEVVQDEFKSRIMDILDGEAILIARGGKGGRGNASYATSTNQQPVLAQRGGRGEERCLLLELKLLSDVALIGKPNAGKSTILSKCSAAKPKIADYPFTTVEPLLGVVDVRGMSFVMMEVPGLLEGAHQGVGLGLEFLRHAERTRVYWHILDGFSENPVADLKAVNQELRLFNPELQAKPRIVVVNKMDITQVRAEKEVLEDRLKRALAASGKSKDLNTEEPPVFFISAATGEGMPNLLDATVRLLDSLRKKEKVLEPQLGGEPRQLRGLERRNSTSMVVIENGVYVVKSDELERLAEGSDINDYRVMLQLWKEMSRRGLSRRLQEAGVSTGDTIRIGKVELEWS